MCNGIDKFISTGTIRVLVMFKDETGNSVDFHPDADHTVTTFTDETDESTQKNAVFLKTPLSTPDAKNPEAGSIAKPLTNGIVKLTVTDEEWVKTLSHFAIEQVKVDVFVDKNLELVGFRVPSTQSFN